MTRSPILTADHIGRRTADGTWLLRDVSIDVRAGQRWAITGSTGSGKTILLRALAMLDRIDEGRILWNGAEVADQRVPDYRRDVIYVHQRPVLLEGTVEFNLRAAYGLKAAAGATFNRDGVAALLRGLGRDEAFLQKASGNLSGGEQQIVALLRAAQLAPSILLLDEPTAALDAKAMRAIETVVAQWFEQSQEKCAVVWVSHDAAQVERVADRVLPLEGGRVRDADFDGKT